MAKGKTTKPLLIAVAPAWLMRDDIQALAAAGHRVEAIVTDADLILHPAAHRWGDVFFDADMLPIAVKAAQRLKPTKRRSE
jgi:virulence-associated protein VagC